MSWYLHVLSQYSNFNGRARRREYWVFTLISFAVTVVLAIFDVVFGLFSEEVGFGVLSGLYTLATFLPSIAVGIRRLHDTDRSGYWLLLALLPLLGGLVLLVLLLFDGDRTSNKYGPNPKAPSY